MQMYSESDVDTSRLSGKQVTILGYGSQGRAHALNLKDSGFNVVVGLRRDGARMDGDSLSARQRKRRGRAVVDLYRVGNVRHARGGRR